MKNYFPNKSTPILQKKMLIQPFFVDQRLKSKKLLKEWAIIIVLESIHHN